MVKPLSKQSAKGSGLVDRSLSLRARSSAGNTWLSSGSSERDSADRTGETQPLEYRVLETEEQVGQAMLDEIRHAWRQKQQDLVIVLLGGRGAQSLHRQLGELAAKGTEDRMLASLKVFTQDALAPMRMDNSFSFVRDFERLLGNEFFAKVKCFTPMRTDAIDLEAELARYVEDLQGAGGIDIFFLGHGPESGGASHLAYIKPNSGARASDLAGVIPISQSILEHHISKFRAGGAAVNQSDELECRRASHIMTLGPAAILGARRLIQSIVDAGTAPAKRESYRRVLEAKLSSDPDERLRQLDANPGLWIRQHRNAVSLILPDVLQA
ncbi:MAG TPA: hypothetical protein VKM94_00625 [Blastocatellia bacterium]|nr:hypothetical protein [Blastocatellia bacterium]